MWEKVETSGVMAAWQLTTRGHVCTHIQSHGSQVASYSELLKQLTGATASQCDKLPQNLLVVLVELNYTGIA